MNTLLAAIGRHYKQRAAEPVQDTALRTAIAHDLSIQRREPASAYDDQERQ